MPEIIRITSTQADAYRNVRLRALREDPMSFSSTYAREAAFTEAEWLARCTGMDGQSRIGFLAIDAGEPCGVALCFRNDQEPDADIISVWVAPSHRGTGVAWSLMEALRAWAQSRGIATLRLMVTSYNARAIRFYERFGFTRTGKTEPYPNDPQLVQFEMMRKTAASD